MGRQKSIKKRGSYLRRKHDEGLMFSDNTLISVWRHKRLNSQSQGLRTQRWHCVCVHSRFLLTSTGLTCSLHASIRPQVEGNTLTLRLAKCYLVERMNPACSLQDHIPHLNLGVCIFLSGFYKVFKLFKCRLDLSWHLLIVPSDYCFLFSWKWNMQLVS